MLASYYIINSYYIKNRKIVTLSAAITLMAVTELLAATNHSKNVKNIVSRNSITMGKKRIEEE